MDPFAVLIVVIVIGISLISRSSDEWFLVVCCSHLWQAINQSEYSFLLKRGSCYNLYGHAQMQLMCSQQSARRTYRHESEIAFSIERLSTSFHCYADPDMESSPKYG